jgi:hypothetical protein
MSATSEWTEVGHLCPAAYDEPQERSQDTGGQRVEAHTCNRVEGHHGPHHCELCGKNWLARVGVKEQPEADRDQVQQARQDAVEGGIGFVMIVYEVTGDDGMFMHTRVDPERVVVSQKGGD